MSGHNKTNLIIYQTEDGQARVECRLVDETIWLSQAQMKEITEGRYADFDAKRRKAEVFEADERLKSWRWG